MICTVCTLHLDYRTPVPAHHPATSDPVEVGTTHGTVTIASVDTTTSSTSTASMELGKCNLIKTRSSSRLDWVEVK
jgi:hypothetical protein